MDVRLQYDGSDAFDRCHLAAALTLVDFADKVPGAGGLARPKQSFSLLTYTAS